MAEQVRAGAAFRAGDSETALAMLRKLDEASDNSRANFVFVFQRRTAQHGRAAEFGFEHG